MKSVLVLAAILAVSGATQAQDTPTKSGDVSISAPAHVHTDDEKPDVPALKDVPLIGRLFNRNVDDDASSNLAIAFASAESKSPLDDLKIDVDFSDTPVRTALKQLETMAKDKNTIVEFEINKDVPEDAKVTLKLNHVRFDTVVRAVVEAADIHTSGRSIVKDAKDKSTKARYKIAKDASKAGFSSYFTSMGAVNHPFAATISPDNVVIVPPSSRLNLNGDRYKLPPMSNDSLKGLKSLNTVKPFTSYDAAADAYGKATSNLYSLWSQEERSTFTCPHCKQQATILGKREAPKCEKCGRVFQNDWKFCPFDGGKRPKIASAWQFCPHCGKPVTL